MSVVANQQRTFLRLAAALRPHWRTDPALPARLQQLLARDRAFGSRDRRLYRELLYTTLRHLPWIEPRLDRDPAEAAAIVAWLAADTPATARYRAETLAAGAWPACPATVAGRTAVLAARLGPGAALPVPLPEWFRTHCPEAFVPPDLDALLARAPLWLRLQTDAPARVTDEFATRGWRWRASSVLPSALELLDEVDITPTESFARGLVEIQDLGSQLLLASAGLGTGPDPAGTRWLDACAGAGGKTLQLARLLGPGSHVDAHDIRPAALAELAARATRAGIAQVPAIGESRGGPVAESLDRRLAPPGATPRAAATLSILPRLEPGRLYDGVLVDAPCSGSGTWRRAPHLKWVTTEARIAEAATTQLALLHAHAPRVRPGGRLIYATCSLSHVENADVAAAFLAAHPEFSAEPPARDFGALRTGAGLTFLPARHDTDGFFVATFRRR